MPLLKGTTAGPQPQQYEVKTPRRGGAQSPGMGRALLTQSVIRTMAPTIACQEKGIRLGVKELRGWGAASPREPARRWPALPQQQASRGDMQLGVYRSIEAE